MLRAATAVLCLAFVSGMAVGAVATVPESRADAIDTPELINYQGQLLDDAGDPVNGTCDLAFGIFNVATGGSAVWTETQTGVVVTEGLFNVVLGSVTPIAGLPDGPDCYLEVTVGGEVVSPRIRMVSVPYAMNADNTAKLQGTPVSGTPPGSGQVLSYSGSQWEGQTPFEFPAGGIIMWSGSLAGIPAGWQLCDGTNGTPDLRSMFVMGAPDGVEPGGTGGAASVTLTVSNLPDHNHTIGNSGEHSHTGSTSNNGDHNHTYSRPYSTLNAAPLSSGTWRNSLTPDATSNSGIHSHSLSTSTVASHGHTCGNAGSGAAFGVLPPYFQLAFIMKL